MCLLWYERGFRSVRAADRTLTSQECNKENCTEMCISNRCACVRACVRECVRACVRACARARVCVCWEGVPCVFRNFISCGCRSPVGMVCLHGNRPPRVFRITCSGAPLSVNCKTLCWHVRSLLFHTHAHTHTRTHTHTCLSLIHI